MVVFEEKRVIHVCVVNVVFKLAEMGEGGTKGLLDNFDFVCGAHKTKSLHVSDAIPAAVLELIIATLAGPRLWMMAA